MVYGGHYASNVDERGEGKVCHVLRLVMCIAKMGVG